jgi:hypothetical protein
MWIVTAIVNGERRQLMSRVIENEDSPSFEQIRHVASDLPGSGRFVECLEREFSLTLDGDSSVRGFDAVQRWSARAEAQSTYGQPQPVLACSHTRYFEQSEVRQAVLEALPSGPQLSNTGPAGLSGLPDVALDHEITVPTHSRYLVRRDPERVRISVMIFKLY